MVKLKFIPIVCRYGAYGPINVKVVTGSAKKITINRKGTICKHIKDHSNTSFVATTNMTTVSTSHQPPLTISSHPSPPSMVNELFHDLCEDELDEFVWKAKCMDEFGFNWSSEELSISYKECYKRLCKPSVVLWG